MWGVVIFANDQKGLNVYYNLNNKQTNRFQLSHNKIGQIPKACGLFGGKQPNDIRYYCTQKTKMLPVETTVYTVINVFGIRNLFIVDGTFRKSHFSS